MPSRQVLALATKQPTNGPPLFSGLFETIWVVIQCLPLAESKVHEGSPPLLQPRCVRPITVFREMTGDTRFRALLKIRISPLLLVSSTFPLPAHRPWSGGSMSPTKLVGCEALSTALMPLTLVEPPANELMLSQPARSGWQLTVGIWTRGPLACDAARGCRGSDGNALNRSGDFACFPIDLMDRCATDGTRNGPVSRWQPEAQPVAAEPTKVGLNGPMPDDLTAPGRAPVALPCGAAAAGPPMTTRIVAGRARSDSSAIL